MFYFSKESKPKYDLKPTSAEHNSDWHTEFWEFYKEYIPRPVPNNLAMRNVVTNIACLSERQYILLEKNVYQKANMFITKCVFNGSEMH